MSEEQTQVVDDPEEMKEQKEEAKKEDKSTSELTKELEDEYPEPDGHYRQVIHLWANNFRVNIWRRTNYGMRDCESYFCSHEEGEWHVDVD